MNEYFPAGQENIDDLFEFDPEDVADFVLENNREPVDDNEMEDWIDEREERISIESTQDEVEEELLNE